MRYTKENQSFDAIVFYFWLPEEELNTIFLGVHKWWFAHGLGYRRCIFYGPNIKQFKTFKHGEIDLYAIPSAQIKWGLLREFLDRQSISHNPILSIVVEGDRLPNRKELNAASIPIQCFVADTHHMSNPINAAVAYISEVGASMVFVSHSPHRKIFADCLGLNAYPLCYTPNDASGVVLNPVGKRGAHACYYGAISDPFHPERSYILKKITSSSRGSVALDFKPRLQPIKWLESLSKDIASFTCSLNGFPSVQSYAPLLCETCLITDPLSEKSELGPHLRNGENCLIYRDEEEAVDVLEFVLNKPDEARAIARAGNSLLHRITPTLNKSLQDYCENTNQLASSLSERSYAQQKINLNPYAVTACYAYEVVQELHRLCRRLFIFIQGETKVADYIKDYVTILPRVTVLHSAPVELLIPSPMEGECIVWIGNSESCSVNQRTLQGNSLALRISDPKDENLIGKTPGIWLNPSSIIKCDFEGRPFPQFIPENISLFTCPVNSAEVIDSQMHGDDMQVTNKKGVQDIDKNMKKSELKNITDIISNWRADINLPIPAQVILKNNNLISPEVIAELLVALVQSLSYEYFKDIICLVDVCEKALEKNPNAMMVSAFAAWSQGYTNECERWSKNLIAIAPNHPAGYLRLGLNYLTNQQFVEAFVSLSAGMRNANNDQSLIGWFLLAQRMASGPREVAFEKYGKRFRFRLSCFNTQAAESDASHLGGRFTEEQELAFLAGALAGCKSFVEVGALVGNYTVFLASVFRPEKYLVVDADERSIAETTANVELNRENYPQTVFSFVESALAGSGGEEVQIGTKKVMTRTLAELLPDDVDFLKIDIDGMEGALLEPLVAFASDKDIRIFIEVETRFLSDYEKKMATIGYQIIHRTDHGSYLNLLLRKVS